MDDPDEFQPTNTSADEVPPGSNEGDTFEESAATVLTPTAALKAEELPAGMTPRELAHALQGEMLNQFHLQQYVGGGGMGVVFRALDTTLDRVVAVKIVASPSISAEDIQRRFIVEAQSAARLDHPNIARVYDTGRSRGLPYIVLEFVEGINIRDLVINHGPLMLGDALSYSYQIAHALAHAWQRDVVHRDIKPSNILITNTGQAKLVDMGLARLNEQVETPDAELTNTGVTLGTFDYISPEQARDPRAADVRSDIYSLGCTLFFMLAGHAPFSQGTPAQKLLSHQGDRPPELLSLRADVPPAIDKLLQRMLAKQPEDRPQSPTELVGSLAELLRAEGLQTPQALAPLPAIELAHRESVWRRHLPWAAPVAALLAVSGWMSFSQKEAASDVSFPPYQTVEPSPPEEHENAAPKSTLERSEESKPAVVPTEPAFDLGSTGSPQVGSATVDVSPLLDDIVVGPVEGEIGVESDGDLSGASLPLLDGNESPPPLDIELPDAVD